MATQEPPLHSKFLKPRIRIEKLHETGFIRSNKAASSRIARVESPRFCLAIHVIRAIRG
jgi:hypothetical protein